MPGRYVKSLVNMLESSKKNGPAAASLASRVAASALHRKKVDFDEISKLLGILAPHRRNDYTAWLHVGLALHNAEDSQRMLGAWDEFSKGSPKYAAGVCAKKWESFGSPEEKAAGGITLGSLYAWAKEDNPRGYTAIVTARINADILRCNGTPNSIASIAYKILRGRFVCATSNGKLWYHCNDRGLWNVDADGIQLRSALSTTVREHIFEAVNQLCVDDEESASNWDEIRCHAAKLQDTRFKHKVVSELREFMYDSKFESRLDSNPNLIAFSNGVYDLRASRFRDAVPTDLVSLTVGYEYYEHVVEESRRKVIDYWATMHPNPEQRDYVIRMFARQMHGDSGRELFHLHAGSGGSASTGKTKFFQLMDRVFGDYIKRTQVSIFTAKKRAGACKPKPRPEFGTWRGKRFLYITEPEHGEAMNSGVFEALTGGEEVTYRLLYSNDITTFKPQFKIHMQCNDPPKIDGTDQGMKRHVRKIDYVSRFVEAGEADPSNNLYPIDDSLFAELEHNEELRMEFMRYFLEHFDYDWKFEMPSSVELERARP